MQTVYGEAVERIDQNKYMGTVLDDQIKGNANAELMIKPCNERHSVYVDREILL